MHVTGFNWAIGTGNVQEYWKRPVAQVVVHTSLAPTVYLVRQRDIPCCKREYCLRSNCIFIGVFILGLKCNLGSFFCSPCIKCCGCNPIPRVAGSRPLLGAYLETCLEQLVTRMLLPSKKIRFISELCNWMESCEDYTKCYTPSIPPKKYNSKLWDKPNFFFKIWSSL